MWLLNLSVVWLLGSTVQLLGVGAVIYLKKQLRISILLWYLLNEMLTQHTGLLRFVLTCSLDLKKKIVWNELANYFDCFVRFSSKKAIHLENINWLQAGAEFISWDKWIWDKSPLYVFILAAEDDIPLFRSLCCRSNVKELCIGVPMLFKEKFLPPTFSSQRQHLGLEMRAIFNIPFSIIPKWLWIPALTFCFLFHAQSLWSIYFGLVLFFFTFFFPLSFPISLTKMVLWKERHFISWRSWEGGWQISYTGC